MNTSPAANGKTRVLLVDDHELIRQGLARAFERDPGMVIAGQAATVIQALAAFEELKPDVVVTDLQLPDGTGFDIIRAIRQQDPDIGLVMLTMHSGDDQIFAAMEAGASAFVGKDAPSTEVVNSAKHASVSPRTFLCAGLAGAMLRRASDDRPRLSEREQEVLELLADGLGTAAIAGSLYMSESTAKTHIARIYQKLGATNRAQALVTSMRMGLLSTVQPR
jgi:DNA-binding NarL/FixJ family response regulator